MILPGNPSTFGAYNLSFFVYNEKQTKELVDRLFTEQNQVEVEDEEESLEVEDTEQTNQTIETKTEATNSKIKLELLNGCGDLTLFSKAKKALENEGYTISKTGNTNVASKTTIINKNSLSNDTMTNLKDILGVGNISNSNSSANKVDATIVIGKDYK